MSERDAQQVIVIKWWHVIAFTVTILFAVGQFYGAVNSTLRQHDARLEQLDKETVKHAQFDEMAEDLKQRLGRIENKIDAEKSLRSLDLEYQTTRPPRRHKIE